MSKQFKIVFPNNDVVEFTANQYIDAKYALIRYVDHFGFNGCKENGVTTYIRDTEVTAEDFILACEMWLSNWFAKKSVTHKRVQVLYGSSVKCKVWIWVKK